MEVIIWPMTEKERTCQESLFEVWEKQQDSAWTESYLTVQNPNCKSYF